MLPSRHVLQHVVDAHCHPTDALVISPKSMERLEITICAMSSRQSDQPLVASLARNYPNKVIPCFGYHPWFSHLISVDPSLSKDAHYRSLFIPKDPPPASITAYETLLPLLPDPRPLNEVLAELRLNLESFPDAMLGEVGLDRIFKVAHDYSASPRQLTPFTIPLDHQLRILEPQLALAVELGRNVSLHSVKASSAIQDLLNRTQHLYPGKWNDISIDLHSCGLSPETWRDIERRHPNAFLSLSVAINGRSPNHKALIARCSPDRLLVESDYPDVNHCAEMTWKMLQTIAEVRNWPLEEEWAENDDPSQWGTVKRIEENWKRFRAGKHYINQRRRQSK